MSHRRHLLSRCRHRRGEGALGAVAVVGLLIIAATSYVAYTLVPVWFDYLAVKEICRTVVLDWVNHENAGQAVARFNAELRRKGISEDITVEDCRFVDEKGAYEVACSWTQYAYYPGTDYYKTFPLDVHVVFEDGKAVVVSQ